MDTTALIGQLEKIIADPSVVDEGSRQRVRQLARQASVAMEQPYETVRRLAYSALPLVATRISQQHGIFSALVGSQEPVMLDMFRKASDVDDGLLVPLLEYLGTQGLVKEVRPGEYQATKLTQLLLAPLFQDAVTHFHDNCLPAIAALNTAISDKSGKTAFEIGQHSDVDFYTWLESHPDQKGAFHRFMEAQFAGLPTWLDVVDFATLAPEVKDGRVTFVDVGGGAGQQCKLLRDKVPDAQEIVLQDKKQVLAIAHVGFTKMEYDYLTEQPVKGARVYYFRQILHNNDDETCIRILKAQIPALAKDSVIVIDDKCLSDEKSKDDAAVEYTAALSLYMKVMFNAMERREKKWRELVARTGLVVKDIKRFTPFDDAAIILGLP